LAKHVLGSQADGHAIFSLSWWDTTDHDQGVPPGFTVLMMTDRALYARWLYREIQALG
jgi:hypothetical protein